MAHHTLAPWAELVPGQCSGLNPPHMPPAFSHSPRAALAGLLARAPG
jgi:hypothetical protein